jgi:hypothetical protein
MRRRKGTMEVRVTTCKSCRAEIIWVRTPKKKNMPLDATPVPDGDWMLDGEDDEGKTQVAHYNSSAAAAEGGAARYQSHFKSCPNAQKHSNEAKAGREQPSHPHRGAPGATDAATRIVDLTGEVEDLRAKIEVARKAFSRWAATDSAAGCAACEAVQAVFDEQKAKREKRD